MTDLPGEHCGDDASNDGGITPDIEELLDRVLDGDEMADDIAGLSPSLRGPVKDVIQGYQVFFSGEATEALRRLLPDASIPTSEAFVDAIVGGCRLVKLIGQGGQGMVFEAVQGKPERSVAVKILRFGLSDRSAWLRFEQEAQVLARLDHPNLSRVHSAGVHCEGRLTVPYFVMALVAGAQSITEYVTRNRLDTASRISLFVKVCHAVQHAHWKGIIHRDLKPSNILVDPNGEPRVIDFGVARVLEACGDAGAPVTHSGDRIGTAAFMSPEQRSGAAHDVDARTDVFALGLVLHLLLIGELPSEKRPKLRGDLSAIILKATAASLDRRYDSPLALALDLQRHLENEPIQARLPSLTYRLICLARRRRWVFATAATAILAVLAAYVMTGLAWNRTRRALADEYAMTDALRLQAAIASLANGDFRQAKAHLDGIRSTEAHWEVESVRGRVDAAILSQIVDVDGAVDALAFEHRGSRLAIGTDDPNAMLVLYDVDARVRRAAIDRALIAPDATLVHDLVFSPDDAVLVAATGKEIVAWSTITGDLRERWRWSTSPTYGQRATINELACHPTRAVLVAVSVDGGRQELHVIKPDESFLAAPEPIRTTTLLIRDPALEITDIAFSPDGRVLAATSYRSPYATVMWDLDTIEKARDVLPPATEVHRHRSQTHSLAFLPDGRLASADSLGGVTITAIGPTGPTTPLRQESFPVPTPVRCIDAPANGDFLACAGGDHRVWFYGFDPRALGNQPRLTSVPGQSREISALATNRRNVVASGSRDGTVCLQQWTDHEVPTLAERGSSVLGLVVVCGNHVATLAPDERGLMISRLDSCETVAFEPIEFGDCDMHLAGPGGGAVFVVLWETKDSRLTGHIQRFDVTVPAQPKLTGDWRIETLSLAGGIQAVTVPADGRRLALLDRRGNVRVYEIRDSAELELRFSRVVDGSRTCTFVDAAGNSLLVGGTRLELFDLNKDRAIGATEDLDSPIDAVAITADGKGVATGHKDGSVRFAALAGTKRRIELERGHGLHAASVAAIVYHPVEDRLFSASRDGQLMVWDTARRVSIVNFSDLKAAVNHLAFDGETERLVVSSLGFLGSENHCVVYDRNYDPAVTRLRAARSK